jgi:histidyl-tRNA synthetase
MAKLVRGPYPGIVLNEVFEGDGDLLSFLRYGRLWITGKFMNRLLILGILIISTAPLFAQAQQFNAAELAQKVVSIISGDKAKTQTYCQILDLSDELDQADQQKDREKAEEMSQKINELQKKLGPEYLALLKATEHVDPNSKDGQEIVSNLVKLDNSCGQR